MGAHGAYWVAVGIGAVLTVLACVVARRSSARVALVISRCLAVVLAATAVAFCLGPVVDGTFTVRNSLPLQLCDVAAIIVVVTCWFPRWRLGFELTYFWGLAGTLQGVVTPDLGASFPHLEFFVFVVAHIGIVMAALYLAIGMRAAPRRFAPLWVFGITVGLAAVDAVADWKLGANYMYLAHIPPSASLLSVLGPWPVYIASAAGVAVVLFAVLDAPFWLRRRIAGSGRNSSRVTVAAGAIASPGVMASLEAAASSDVTGTPGVTAFPDVAARPPGRTASPEDAPPRRPTPAGSDR